MGDRDEERKEVFIPLGTLPQEATFCKEERKGVLHSITLWLEEQHLGGRRKTCRSDLVYFYAGNKKIYIFII